MRFRHGDPEKSAELDRAHRQRLETLDSFAAMPDLPASIALLVSKLRQKYGNRRAAPGDTRCLVCGAECKTSQGLSAHMRFRHGAGASSSGFGSPAELLRALARHTYPEAIEEAIWEKVLRLEGFRW
jgi:hypothetical protein